MRERDAKCSTREPGNTAKANNPLNTWARSAPNGEIAKEKSFAHLVHHRSAAVRSRKAHLKLIHTCTSNSYLPTDTEEITDLV